MLEPGGTFSIEGKTPVKAEQQHAELLAQLKQINERLNLLAGKYAAERKQPEAETHS